MNLFYRLACLVAVLPLASTWAQPSGTLLVLNKADDTAQFIAQPSGDTVATVETGRGPHEAAVSPDGTWAVGANYENPDLPTLSVYNAETFEFVKTIDLGESLRPHGLAFLAQSSVLAVTCEGTRHLILVDIETGQVTARIDTKANGSHMVAVTPDGTRAFVPNMGDDNVTAIDLKAKAVLKLIPTGPEAEGIDVTPDGREVWVTNRRGHSVSVIDAQSLEVVETFRCEGFPIRCKVTPDGAQVLVSCATTGEIAFIDRATRKETARLKVHDRPESGIGPIGVLISPDGGHAWVANSTVREVVVVDIEKREIVTRIETGNVPDGLAFIPVPARHPAENDPVAR